MTESEIKKLIEEEVKKQIKEQIEKLFGRTAVQLREYFLKNIT